MRIERFEDIEAWQYITAAEFQDVYDHAGRTRAAIRGFINYLVSYEREHRNELNPEP